MKARGFEFKFGCDPEVFVIHKRSGDFVCPYGMVPGTKTNPAELDSYGNTIQLDGMAAEIGIPPCSSVESFIDQVQKALRSLDKLLGPSHTYAITPTAHFKPEVMKKAPGECLQLGCDADYNDPWQRRKHAQIGQQ